MPTVYSSGDASAPVLTGQVGSLIGVLDACLVNGYGSKTAAGWSKAYSGTNAADYRQASSGMYLDVNDNAAGSGGAQEANVRGYETMTALATGSNAFPTTAQQGSPGLYVRKSASADATSRGWVVLADGQTFHLFILSGDTVGRYQSFSFGAFYSFKSGDAYKNCIIGHTAPGASSASGLDGGSLATSPTTTTSGSYIDRTQAGTGTSITCGVMGLGSLVFTQPFNGPNLPDGNVYISRLFVSEASTANGLRGYVRGLYQIITASGLNDGDTFSGTGDFAGRSFTVLNRSNGGAYLALETSAWDTSV